MLQENKPVRCSKTELDGKALAAVLVPENKHHHMHYIVPVNALHFGFLKETTTTTKTTTPTTTTPHTFDMDDTHAHV